MQVGGLQGANVPTGARSVDPDQIREAQELLQERISPGGPGSQDVVGHPHITHKGKAPGELLGDSVGSS
eukprot:6834948-Pyramimonas_sp.AAC.1